MNRIYTILVLAGVFSLVTLGILTKKTEVLTKKGENLESTNKVQKQQQVFNVKNLENSNLKAAMMDQTCNCTEYVYLNEPILGAVLKFQVNNPIPLTEVLGANGGTLGTHHWYPGTLTSELPGPHGLATDLNGNLYIAEQFTNPTQIRKFNCDGTITPEMDYVINHNFNNMFNMFSIGNTIYTSRTAGPAAWDACNGTFIGNMCLNDENGNMIPYNGDHFWGLSYNAQTQTVYLTKRNNDNRNKAVWAFSRVQLEAGINGGPCIDPLIPLGTSATINVGDNYIPTSINELLGIVGDNSGNIYVVGWTGGADNGVILKYDAAGGFLDMSVVVMEAVQTHGIVWSANTNRLFVANYTDDPAVDCISAYDANNLDYLGTAVPNPNIPANNTAKALAILTECCPIDLPVAIMDTVCVQPGTKIFLNEIAFSGCEGIVCGTSWEQVNLGGAMYEPCDNSIIVLGEGCSTFNLSIDEVSSTGCGTQSTVYTICNQCNVDLALVKTIADTLGNGKLEYGDTIKFAIELINQGNEYIDSLIVTDSIPNGYTFVTGPLNSGWTLMGNEAKYNWGLNDTLTEGETDTICIYLRVQKVNSGIADYTNRAEISQAWSVFEINGVKKDVSDEDIDSPLDDNYGNNGGGQPESPADDYTEGDGTGVPGDGVSTTDQDNADGALLEIVDLALKKVIVDTLGNAKLEFGDTIKFAIQLLNQGGVPIDSMVIIDSIPNGYSFVPGSLNAGWNLLGNEAFYNWGAGDTLVSNESDTICIYLKIEKVLSGPSDYTNKAEIAQAFDTNGDDVSNDDIDSPLDNNYGNSGGGQPESPADNALDGNGTGVPGGTVAGTDQDNSDAAILDIVDLALTKTIADTLGDASLYYGDTVKFAIVLFHQGGTSIDSLLVTDSIPNGFSFVGGSLNNGWNVLGNKATYRWGAGDTLVSGESDTICIYLRIENVQGGDYTNRAEISQAWNVLGTDVSDQDVDSPLDAIYGNNPGGQPGSPADDYTEGNGTGVIGDGNNATDQDNADPAGLEIVLYSLGNTVWADTDNDGLKDNTEAGYASVKLYLHKYDSINMVCVLIDSTITNPDGDYLFDSLEAGIYLIEVAQSNFLMGNPLYGTASSTGTNGSSTGPYEGGPFLGDVDTIDSDDNGMHINGMGVWSDSIRLFGGEPLADTADLDDNSGALNENSNLTVDFGFYTLHSIGNTLFVDVDNDGIKDPAEAGIPNVMMIVHQVVNGMCIAVDTVFTDINGDYLFDSLYAGRYVVEIDETNFAMGAPLEGYVSSTGSGPADLSTGPYEDGQFLTDINTTDGDDNGNALNGGIWSDTVNLNGNEPIGVLDSADLDDNSGALDQHSNLTLDFGVLPLHTLGNTVWFDTNNDGIKQDAELGIENVKVILHYYDPVTMTCVTLDSVLTDANGGYLFDSLIAGTYLIEIPSGNIDPGGPLEGYASSTGSNGSNSGPYEDGLIMSDADQTDNDDNGTTLATGSVWSDSIKLVTGAEAINPVDTAGKDDTSGALDENSDLTIDFGFYPLHSIGNSVWEDGDNNGKQDPGENGIESVLVILHYFDGMQCIAIDSVYTDPNGGYLFDSLKSGQYLVEIAAINFLPGGPLATYASSSGALADNLTSGPNETAPDPDDDIDLDDNGTMNGNPMFPGSVFSDTLDLDINEPTGPADSAGLDDNSGALDGRSNLTVDFGFVPMHSIGNLVWVDANNNGRADLNEGVIENVMVILHWVNPAGGCVAVDTQFTDASGKYLFDSLVAGNYLVEIDESNFLSGGPLYKFASSTGGTYDLTTTTGSLYEDAANPNDPDNNTDNDDNGILNGNANFIGSVMSDTIALNGNEPTDETDGTTGATDTTYDASGAANERSNLTVDFGFVPLHSIGNQLFSDANNDGLYNPADGDLPFEGVTIVLHYVDTFGGGSVCRALDTFVTGPDGLYYFDSLIAGRYILEVPGFNFDAGGPLENYASSTGTGLGGSTTTGPNEDELIPVDPNFTIDNYDKGVYQHSGPFLGSVVSDTLDLGEDEPTGEDDNDTTAFDENGNMTLDFGFIELHSLGNMVFTDRNNDGLYDPLKEQVIEGVVMELHQVIPDGDGGLMCVIVGYDTTDANGLYAFDSLIAGRYVVAISQVNFDPGGALAKGFVSSTGTGNAYTPGVGPYEAQSEPTEWDDQNADNNDNGSLMATIGSPLDGLIASDTIDLGDGTEPLNEDPYNDSTVTDGNNNLTIDFGLIPLNSIGNQVWWDTDNDGLYDRMTEVPIAGVEVVLHWFNEDAGVCVALDTVLTDVTGRYLFGYLLEGKYLIEITAQNFLPGGPLDGFASSTAGVDLTSGPYETLNAQTDGDSDVDDTDHGIKDLGFPGSVASDTITLTSGQEPDMGAEFDPEYDTTGAPYPANATPDSNSNLTIDFGFAPLHSIGNQVFADYENNGVFTPGLDDPMVGVLVILHYVDPVSGTCIAIDSTLTDAEGLYLFDSLNAGRYIVEIAKSNFDIGGVLEGWFSSTGTPGDLENGPFEDAPIDPNDPNKLDAQDNGVLAKTGPFLGSVITDTIELTDNAEPTSTVETSVPSNDNSGALDDNSNLTIDFGFVLPCQELTCIAKVNISLDESCQHCLSNKDVLKGKYKIPDKFFDIEIFDAAGRKLPGNCIGREYMGYDLTYKITSKYPCDVNSCWGNLKVEDKSGPAIVCTTDTIVCSELSTLPSSGYTVKDNCSGLEAKVAIADEQFIDYGCDSVLQGKIVRQLVARDIWGNTTNCTKTYVIEKVSLSNVICPANAIYECGQSIANAPVPTVLTRRGLIPLWPNNPSCKITVSFKDERQNSCGSGSYKIFRTWTIADWCTGEDTICKQVIEVIDRTQPGLTNKNLGTIAANPHDCGVEISLDTLVSTDCSKVTQSFRYKYRDGAGVLRVASGSLPGKIWVYPTEDSIEVTAADACNNIRTGWIVVRVEDKTPPTPVCKEFTQVTVDPASCWGFVLAKDLDNGSHDNCIETLHFAAAKMVDIEKARKDYEKRIIDSCGNKAYWENKSWYDAYIEQWINCYVFSDTIHLDDCGSNQVVLRVYEADSLPRLDPHLWACSPHAWFCYNSYPEYRIVHNINKSCGDKAPWLCKSASESWFETRRANTSYRESNYVGANATRLLPQTHLYNDCMVNVLVDDKQAPVVAGLEDILVYCDGAPSGSANARYYCESGESYYNWPGDIKDGKGIIHGYYGGSNFVPNHDNADDHKPSTGCDDNKWAPIYCRKWLLLDSNEQAGKIDPKAYFDRYVLFDKNRPARTLAGNEFSFTDNCKLDDGTLTESITGTLNGCGEGWLQKTWTIKDKCGNIATATQKIIVKHRSDFEVIFPADLDVACESSNATDTSRTGIPKISDDECEQVGVRYEDEISSIVDGGCYKIIRTWTLIDWCIYDVNAYTTHPDVIVNDTFRANQTDRACVFRNLKDNGDGIIKYVQIIKVTDKEAPKLSCRDTTIDMTAGCDVNVSIPLKATDNCAETILFKIDLTRPDGSTETRAITNGIWNTTFSAGTYIAVITGKDHCGNESSCTMKITVRDGKKPTPYCLNGVATVVMPSTGTLEIWAKDLDRASEDNCTPKDKLKFSFTKNTADASKVVGCKDIRDGREQLLDLDIWVTDESGNQDLCKTYILLQDNGGQPGGVCKDTTVSLANITGRLYTEDQEGVEFAEVKVTGAGSVGIPTFKTKTDGSYTFSALPMNGIASIQALRNDNPMNGVSTLDLVLIQKHILGTERLKSPYKMIAADVDNNRDISAIDLLELRKLILGIYDKLPDNTSWKFVPKSYTFDDVTNPWSYPNEDLITNMKESMTRDFVGVKVGDVNSSAVAHSLMGTEIRSTETGLIFEVEDRTFKAGETVKVEFRSPNFAGVSGFQGTLSINNEELRIENEIQTGSLKFNDQNIGKRWMNEGLITMSWNEKTGIDIDSDKVLFTMTFKAEKDGKLSEVMRIGSQRTKAESYEGKGELGNLSIRFTRDGKEVSGTNALYQNYPNPFDQRTVIGINLAQSMQGVMKITDITGRVLKTIDREWNKGYNEVWLDRRDIKATGILYYSFESLPTGKDGKSFNAVKKMILME